MVEEEEKKKAARGERKMKGKKKGNETLCKGTETLREILVNDSHATVSYEKSDDR